MLYAISGFDAPRSLERRLALRPAHLERLQALQAEGRLVIAGPHPLLDAPDLSGGVSGSLIIAEFATLEAARSWADADPYLSGGVYERVDVRPFIKALPK
jgi:uncharacterized protein YciI